MRRIKKNLSYLKGYWKSLSYFDRLTILLAFLFILILYYPSILIVIDHIESFIIFIKRVLEINQELKEICN